MNRMQDGMPGDKLDALFAEYRGAVPDVDGTAQFMPNLWRRIDERRNANTSVFRRLSQVFVVATAAVTLLLVTVVIPQMQHEQVLSASYVEALAADHDYTDLLK